MTMPKNRGNEVQLQRLRHRRFSRRRIYRRRRRVGFSVFCALVAVTLLGAFSPSFENQAQTIDTTLKRVEVPDLAQAPAPVSGKEIAEAKEAKERAEAEKKEQTEKEKEKKAAEEAEKRAEAEKKEQAGKAPPEEALPPEPSDPTMYLTIPKLGLYDNTVFNDSSPWTLDQGAVKIPSTGFPWQNNANTYIAGHRIGYSGTQSYNQFYNLPNMAPGDQVILTDVNGNSYIYEVTDVFAVTPQENWVTNPVAGRNMITLQTCVASVNDWWTITPGLLSSPPGPETARLIVQAERVDIQKA
jgi:sortase A